MHSLITFLLFVKDKGINTSFTPWHLGSQSCEKAFRACRSLSSTFSTILNFGMLGLLRQLHRMQIQIALETEDNEMKFQRRNKREQIRVQYGWYIT